MFDPERLRSKTKTLSGGEKNRLLLAKLFTKTANLLVLDEPTNDLDVETLELLEELVVDYKGTILIVSHDRTFLDNVVTSTWVFEGDGRVDEYFGGYQDYLRQSKQLGQPVNASINASNKASGGTSKKNSEQKSKADSGKKKDDTSKLTYKERIELEKLPAEIDKLEMKQNNLQAEMASADFYQQSTDAQQAKNKALADVVKALEVAFERWELLDNQ